MSKFEIGDRVRYIDPEDNGSWIERQVCEGWEGTIVRKFDFAGCDDYWKVEWDIKPITEESEDCLELVSRPSDDPKTAFITELKALLEKYDACIRQSPDFGIISIYIGNGDEEMKYSNEFITPKNIFDYYNYDK